MFITMTTRQDSYHNTVSKMARKYSQCHRLPEISELLILRSDSSEIGYEDQKDIYAQVKHVLPIQQTANQMDKQLFSETDEFEMRQAMEQMVDNEMEKIKIKQEFEQEFEQELIRRKSDPQFCNELNVPFHNVPFHNFEKTTLNEYSTLYTRTVYWYRFASQICIFSQQIDCNWWKYPAYQLKMMHC